MLRFSVGHPTKSISNGKVVLLSRNLGTWSVNQKRHVTLICIEYPQVSICLNNNNNNVKLNFPDSFLNNSVLISSINVNTI